MADRLRALLVCLLGLPDECFWRFRLDVASLSVVRTYPEGGVLELWNDTSHLASAQLENQPMSTQLTLILGGVRAGKSSYAQQLAEQGGRVLFVATAEAGDAEMARRISGTSRRAARPPGTPWKNPSISSPRWLRCCPVTTRSCSTASLSGSAICCSRITTRTQVKSTSPPKPTGCSISTAQAPRPGSWSATKSAWESSPQPELGRLYADKLGRTNQIVAAAADDVYFMAAGLPLSLKHRNRPS